MIPDDTAGVTMICTLLLSLKMTYSFVKEGKLRGGLGMRAPEDVALNPKGKEQKFGSVSENGPPKLVAKQQRWSRICANDLENIPIGLVIAWGSVLCGTCSSIHNPLLLSFTVCRYGHTLCYAYGSLFRPVAFGVGLFSVFGLAGASIYTRFFS